MNYVDRATASRAIKLSCLQYAYMLSNTGHDFVFRYELYYERLSLRTDYIGSS